MAEVACRQTARLYRFPVGVAANLRKNEPDEVENRLALLLGEMAPGRQKDQFVRIVDQLTRLRRAGKIQQAGGRAPKSRSEKP